MSKYVMTEVCVPIDLENPSIEKEMDKCVYCGQCKNICRDYINVDSRYDLEKTDDEVICINCGQCANVCPVNSIKEKSLVNEVEAALNDSSKQVIVSVSPAIRSSLGEEFKMEEGEFVEGKIPTLLRELGFDYILDTNFGADLTIMEEVKELESRLLNNGVLPQFTSCCPAWVKYAEIFHPDMLNNLSSCKSPIGMQGATIKSYYAKKMNLDPKNIVNVFITPCTAKKFEINREEMNDAGKLINEDLRDSDYVITTRELAQMALKNNIDFISLKDSEFDKFMSEASGSGVIFGNSGGVMEAALRTLNSLKGSGELELSSLRGLDSIKEASVKIGDITINVAVIYGPKNASKVIEMVKNGEKDYHFIEVMTCPGGCIGGGGQPKSLNLNDELRQKRIDSLYKRDSELSLKTSDMNDEIKMLYDEYYGSPGSELAHKLLHTSYVDRSDSLGEKLS